MQDMLLAAVHEKNTRTDQSIVFEGVGITRHSTGCHEHPEYG